MNPKQIITTVLLVFVIGSVGAMILSEIRQKPVTADPAVQGASAQETDVDQGHRVIAYYFYGTARCMTCRTIEAYTEEALKEGFAEAIDEGLLVWKPVNTDEPGNEHFIPDYQLHTKSVVLSDLWDGQELTWKNLDQIWSLVGNKDAFIAYIRTETENMLGANDV